jgi:MFS family permease
MSFSVRARLSTMMALIYAVQGAWYPLLALHLGDLGLGGRERGWIFAMAPLATLFTALGAGTLVDRRIASQRYLAICYATGAVLMCSIAIGPPLGPIGLSGLFLFYWLIIGPTSGIAASLALRNLRSTREDFGGVRLWGTVGWMVVGWVVSVSLVWTGSANSGRGAFEAFWIAAFLSALLSAFCWTCLPDTPPLAPARGPSRFDGAGALLRTPSVAVYLVGAFCVSLTMPFVYQVLPSYLESRGLPRAWSATALTLGQWPEVLALAALPWLLRRLGAKTTLLLGVGAYFVRFGSLALRPPLWVAVAGMPLHGIGIACFTVGGQVFLDSRAPGERRAGAQALNMVVSSGLGMLLGSLLAGELVVWCRGDMAAVFLVPCSIHAGLIGFLGLAFRPDVRATKRHALFSPRITKTRDPSGPIVARTGQLAVESADG